MQTNIIPVFTAVVADEPVQLCNARDLHSTMQVGRDFATWIKDRIDTFGFVEGEDFVIAQTLSSPNPGSAKSRAQKRIDYHLTLDMAKELAMVENNEIGRQVRRYFIQLEKKAIAAGLKADVTVTRAQIGELATLMAERFPVGKDRPYAWSRFNNHFRIASYKDLPAEKFSDACDYIRQMPTKDTSPALHAPEPANIDAMATHVLSRPGVRVIATFYQDPETGGTGFVAKSIPENASVLTDDDIIKYVAEPQQFPRSLIPELIKAAAARLPA